MRPRQGDIVLIPVPFTDLSSRKRRPVIVVSALLPELVRQGIVTIGAASPAH